MASNALLDLINILSEEELILVSKIKLIGKEKEQFELIRMYRHAEQPSPKELTAILGTTENHFYKNISILLKKCLDVLVPEGGADLLLYLNQKDLYPLSRHELSLMEKRLNKETRESRAKFYYQAFEVMHRVSFKNYDEKFIRTLAEKYFENVEKKDQKVELKFESQILCANIYIANSKGILSTEKENIYNKLQEHSKLLEFNSGPIALFHHYNANSLYYGQIETDTEKQVSYLEKMHTLCLNNPSDFTDLQKTTVVCKIAESLYNRSMFRQALNTYLDILNKDPFNMSKDHYHTTKAIQISIILKEFDSALKLLEERFRVYITNPGITTTNMASISYAKLYLSKGLPEEAKFYIDLGIEINSKNFYLQYEIELRNLQNTYYFLKGEFDFAYELAKRNLKFLQSRNLNLNTSNYGYYFALIQSFVKLMDSGTEISKKQAEKFKLYQTSVYAVYGGLLNQMFEIAVKLKEKKG